MSSSRGTQSSDASKKHEAGRRIQELRVLQTELTSLKPGARVYKQQPNSVVLFMQHKNRVFSDAKKDLDDLVAEYELMEKLDCTDGAETGTATG